MRSRVRILSDHTIETLWEHSEEGSSPDMGPVRDLPGGLRGRLIFLLLRLQGAVRPAGDTYALTEKGQAEGARLSRNHRLWSAYLTTHAEVAPSHVDWSVDQVEHVLSDELVQKLERIVELEDARA